MSDSLRLASSELTIRHRFPIKASTSSLASDSTRSLGSDRYQPSIPPPSMLSADQKAAYLRLSPSERVQFHQLWNLVDWDTQGALANLLGSGSLLSDRDLRSKQSLLKTLNRLATEPLPPDLDRSSLLSGLIQQVQDPGTITQGERGTCTVTTAEYMLASRAPAEYARVVTDLASASGRVVLANGARAERVPDSTAPDGSGRSAASRLFQSAMMEFGNPWLHYSDKKDRWGIGAFSFGSGLLDSEVPKVINALLKDHYYNETPLPIIDGTPGSLGNDSLMKDLETKIAKGQQVPASIDWLGSGHEILILKIENGRAYFRNPWGPSPLPPGSVTDGLDGPKRRIETTGGIESMPIDELQPLIAAIAVQST